MSSDKKLNWFEKQPKFTKEIIKERLKKYDWSMEEPISPYNIKYLKDEEKAPYTRSELIEYLKIMYNHAIGCSCLYRMNLEQLEAAVVDIYATWVEECEKEEKILKNPPKSVSNVLASSVCESFKRQSEEIDMKIANSKLNKKNSEKLKEKFPELNFDKKEEGKCNCGGNCNCHTKQKAKLTLADGREIEVEISEEELKKIEIKKSPYKFSDWHETMYFVNDCGVVADLLPDIKDEGYLTGLIGNENFYNDKDFAEKCARADLLMRKLRKFAVESNLNKETTVYKYSILCGPLGKITSNVIHKDSSYSHMGTIIFKDVADCTKAIEMFKDELIWYFTEYLKIYE